MNKEFQWTDELVKEFMLTYNKIDKLITGVDPIMQTMQEWKASHTPEVKRDWQVESYITDYLGIARERFIRSSDDEFKTVVPQRWNTLKESALIHNKASIHSVRRLSDNEVFSVGDEVEDKIVKGKKNIINFFVDGNNMLVGFMGHGRNIKDLSKLPQRTKGCNICGGELVLIRGRYPNSDKREVCPTCATERLEQINELSSNAYGVAMKESSIPPLKP